MKNIKRNILKVIAKLILIINISGATYYYLNYYAATDISIIGSIGMGVFITSPVWLILPLYDKFSQNWDKHIEKKYKEESEANYYE